MIAPRRKEELGRFGEDLVTTSVGLGLRLHRQPASGARWPRKEDLEGPASVVQVKTTRNTKWLTQFLSLRDYAKAEGKKPLWYDVYVTDREAVVVERRVVRVIELGVGGDEG